MRCIHVCTLQLKKLHHSWGRGLSQLIGVACNRMRLSSATAARRKKESCYVETGTKSNLFHLKYIPKVLKDPLKVRRVGNQYNNYNRLLCFRHDSQPSIHKDTFFSIYLVSLINMQKYYQIASQRLGISWYQ